MLAERDPRGTRELQAVEQPAARDAVARQHEPLQLQQRPESERGRLRALCFSPDWHRPRTIGVLSSWMSIYIDLRPRCRRHGHGGRLLYARGAPAQIFACNLVLSEDAFAGHAFTNYGAGSFDLSRVHLAAAYPFDSSALSNPTCLLLVCRRWARLGTPLLYEAAIVRTHTQLHALAAALHSAQFLGALVRRLRFEASCGAFLDRVVTRTPRLHTLALSLNTPDEHGFHAFPYPSRGLRAALAQLCLVRLLLKREKYARNGHVDEMLYLICGAVRQWDSLVRSVVVVLMVERRRC